MRAFLFRVCLVLIEAGLLVACMFNFDRSLEGGPPCPVHTYVLILINRHSMIPDCPGFGAACAGRSVWVIDGDVAPRPSIEYVNIHQPYRQRIHGGCRYRRDYAQTRHDDHPPAAVHLSIEIHTAARAPTFHFYACACACACARTLANSVESQRGPAWPANEHHLYTQHPFHFTETACDSRGSALCAPRPRHRTSPRQRA